MTNVFNIFTVMQIFNLVCARMIHDEVNIFKGVLNNCMFCGVFLGICIAHVIIIQFGSFAMKVSKYGLAWE